MQTAKRILLVEDDVDDQFLFCDALNRIHPVISCQIANNGYEALAMIEEPPLFDMVFMDLNMPKMNGFDCLKYLRDKELYKNIPVIMLSTSADKEHIERCKNLGATTYFTKPTSFDELFNKLKNIISKGVNNPSHD